MIGIDNLPGRRADRRLPAARALRAAVRPGGPGPVARGARAVRPPCWRSASSARRARSTRGGLGGGHARMDQAPRGATSSACAPCATTPSSSLSTERARPAPPAAIDVSRVEADPLAARPRAEVHGELGVDEQPPATSEHGRDAVARVGDDEHALDAGRLLAGDERHAHARPDRRRAALPPAAGREAQLDGVRRSRSSPSSAAAGRLVRPRRRRRRRGRRRARRRLTRQARTRHHRLAVGAQLALEQLDRAARAARRASRPPPRRSGPARGSRTSTRASTMSSRGSSARARRPSSADGGPACWKRRVPRPARVLASPAIAAVAERHVERVTATAPASRSAAISSAP